MYIDMYVYMYVCIYMYVYILTNLFIAFCKFVNFFKRFYVNLFQPCLFQHF